MKLKIYGCRGSMPLSHNFDKRFGGNTSCIKLMAGDYSLVLDAGSGLVNLGHDIYVHNAPKGPQDVLISHLHMDHIIGLSVFSPGLDAERGLRIYTVSRDGNKSLASQVLDPFSPPYWPVPMQDAIFAEFIEITEDAPFAAGPLMVTPFAASHPDKTTSFFITDGKKSLVYLLDSEVSIMGDADYAQLVDYCRSADLVIFDAAYSPEDYHRFKGWGHSTVLDGVRLRKDSNCKRMMFCHFAQKYSDEEILSWSQYFDGDHYIFAADEMEVTL